MNFRTSEDILTNVKGYEVGSEIKFKAGYKIFTSATSTIQSVSSGSTPEWLYYTISDGAIALTVSLAASAVTSMLF